MMEVVKVLALGFTVGAIFGLFRLVPPAPASWAGVAGIIGIVAGWWLLSRILAPTV